MASCGAVCSESVGKAWSVMMNAVRVLWVAVHWQSLIAVTCSDEEVLDVVAMGVRTLVWD